MHGPVLVKLPGYASLLGMPAVAAVSGEGSTTFQHSRVAARDSRVAMCAASPFLRSQQMWPRHAQCALFAGTPVQCLHTVCYSSLTTVSPLPQSCAPLYLAGALRAPGPNTTVQLDTPELYGIKSFSNDGGLTTIADCFMPMDLTSCLPASEPPTTTLVYWWVACCAQCARHAAPAVTMHHCARCCEAAALIPNCFLMECLQAGRGRLPCTPPSESRHLLHCSPS